MRINQGILMAALACWSFYSAKAQIALDSLQKVYAQTSADTSKVKLLLEIGFEQEAINYDSAFATYQKALRISEGVGYAMGMAKSQQYSGIVLTEMGRYAEAVIAYKKAKLHYTVINDAKGLATTDNNLGNTFLYMANYEEAVRHYLLARPVFEFEKNDYALVVLYGNLGECYRQLGEYNEMLQVARRSYASAQRLNDKTEIANAGISLGTALSLNHQSDSARVFLETSYELANELQDDGIRFYALHDLADDAIKRKDAVQALLLADSCLNAAQSFARTYTIISAHIMRGRALEINDKMPEAQQEFEIALENARLEHSLEMELEALDFLSHHFEKSGKQNLAIQMRNEWMVVNDSIFNNTKSRQIAELRTLYETAENEKLLAEEKSQSAAKDEKIERRNFYLLAAMLALVLVMSTAYFIIKTNRTKRKLAEQESQTILKEQESVKLRSLIEGQEKERNRLGRELHDGLGGMLTAARLQLEQLSDESNLGFAKDHYTNLQNLIAKAGKEMRDISHDLAPEGLDKLGLAESIRQFCHRISNPTTQVTCEIFGEPFSLGSVEDVSVYRIVQELLNNVMKHAAASEAFVSLSFSVLVLTLVVEDNGKGFETATNGKGLSNIASRVAFLQGEMDVISKPSQGTSFTITLQKHG